jgi:hypothetical protein
MRFGLARFVIFVMRATIQPIISPIGIAAIVALAPFKVFSVRLAAFIAEFFESVGGGPESIRCRAERVDEAAIHPTLPASPSLAEIDLAEISHLKFDHIFVKSGLKLCQDWGKTGLRQSRKLPTWSKNYPSSSSRCGSSGVSAGGIG